MLERSYSPFGMRSEGTEAEQAEIERPKQIEMLDRSYSPFGDALGGRACKNISRDCCFYLETFFMSMYTVPVLDPVERRRLHKS